MSVLLVMGELFTTPSKEDCKRDTSELKCHPPDGHDLEKIASTEDKGKDKGKQSPNDTEIMSG